MAHCLPQVDNTRTGIYFFQTDFFVLFHLALSHSSVWGARFDTCSQLDQEYEYTSLSLKAATSCEEQNLGGFSLAKRNNSSFFAHELYQKSLCHSSRTQISWKTTQCCSQLQEDKKTEQRLAGRTKYSVVCSLKPQKFALLFSMAGHKLWTTHLEQVLRFGSLIWTEFV